MRRSVASDAPASSRATWFGELCVEFDDRVLRPRTWTLLQTEWAVELLRDLPPGRVLELCAGAGHIGLLTAMRSGRSLVQVELDEIAAGYARRNAHRIGLARRVSVRRGDMATVLGETEVFPLVIADPPYLRTSEVRQYPEDPTLAVDGGADGLAVTQQALRVTDTHLGFQGACLLQVRDEHQADAVDRWLESQGMNLRRVEQRMVDRGGVVLLRKVVDRW